MKISNQMELPSKCQTWTKKIMLYGYYFFFDQVWQFTRKLHLIGNFHKLAQIYFIVFLKTPPTYNDIGPSLIPPTALNNKCVLLHKHE